MKQYTTSDFAKDCASHKLTVIIETTMGNEPLRMIHSVYRIEKTRIVMEKMKGRDFDTKTLKHVIERIKSAFVTNRIKIITIEKEKLR